MRAKRVYEFLKTGDVKSSLGIGRVAEIREIFRSVGIRDDTYIITDTEVIFREGLNLAGTSISKLPDGLSIGGGLNLKGTGIAELPERLSIRKYLDLSGTPISKLPEGLNLTGNLYLGGTAITKLPEDLRVGGHIWINSSQIKLAGHIRASKFADKLKLRVW